MMDPNYRPPRYISDGIYPGDYIVRIPVPIDLEPKTNASTNIGSALWSSEFVLHPVLKEVVLEKELPCLSNDVIQYNATNKSQSC